MKLIDKYIKDVLKKETFIDEHNQKFVAIDTDGYTMTVCLYDYYCKRKSQSIGFIGYKIKHEYNRLFGKKTSKKTAYDHYIKGKLQER